MENKEINKVFKQTLKAFVKELMNPCDSFVDDIEKCNTYGDLKELMEDNVEEIAKILNISDCESCDEKDEEIEEKEDEIKNLETSVEELSEYVEELSEYNDEIESELHTAFVPKTLDDQYKIEAFKKSKDNFTVSEMESLLG